MIINGKDYSNAIKKLELLVEGRSANLEEFDKKLRTQEIVDLIKNDKNFKFTSIGSIITYLGYKDNRGTQSWVNRVKAFLSDNNLKLVKKSETFMTCSSCGKKFPHDKNKTGKKFRYCKECYENGEAAKHSARMSHISRPPENVCKNPECGKTLQKGNTGGYCQDCIDKNPELQKIQKGKFRKGAIESIRIQGDARRSYNEMRFANSLKEYFEKEGREVIMTTNKPVVGVWDADVYIESMNIAVLWNGRYWHSKPKQANRDKMKIKSFTENGIKVYIVDDPSSKSDGFVKSELDKFVRYLKTEAGIK